MEWLKKLLEAADKIGGVVGPIEDFLILLKLYTKDPVTGTKAPDPKNASTWAKKKQHDDLWGLLTNRLTTGEQTEILQEMFPRLKEIQQCDFVISATTMAMQTAPTHAATINPFEETVIHLKRIAAIKGTDDDHTHQLRMKEADSLNLVRTRPEDYPLYRIERALGRQFTDPNSFVLYTIEHGRQAVVDAVGSVNNAIGKPASAGTPATGLVATTENWLSRARAWRDQA